MISAQMNQTNITDFPFHDFDSPIPTDRHRLSFSSHSSTTSIPALPSPPGYRIAHGVPSVTAFHSPVVSPSSQKQPMPQSQLRAHSSNVQSQQISNMHPGQNHSRSPFQVQGGGNDISRINFLEFRIRKLVIGSYCENSSERLTQMRFRFRFTQRGVSLYLANGAREVGLALASVEDFTLANHKVTMTLRPGAKKRFRRRIASDFFVDINEDITNGNIEKSSHVVMFATEDTDLSLLQLMQLGILHYLGKVGPVVQAKGLNVSASPHASPHHLLHVQSNQLHIARSLNSSAEILVDENQFALALSKMTMKQPAQHVYVKSHHCGQTRILMLPLDASYADMTIAFRQRFGLPVANDKSDIGLIRFECQCEEEFFGRVRLDSEDDWQVAKQLMVDGRMEVWCEVVEE